MNISELAIFVPYFICVGWSIYNLVNLNQLKHKAFLQKRSTFLVHAFNITTILCMISAALGTMAGLYLRSSNLARYCTFLFTVATMYLAFCLLNIKNWMIYYQYNWTYYTLQMQWQQIINDIAAKWDFIKAGKTGLPVYWLGGIHFDPNQEYRCQGNEKYIFPV